VIACCLKIALGGARQQQLVPVVREVNASSAAVSEWKAFVQVADYGGSAYVSLTQVAALLEGQLRWRPVSDQVDLSIRGRTVRFFFNSRRVLLEGRPQRLERATIKNEEG